MKKMFLLTAMLSLSLTSPLAAFGNDKIGNGGDVVNCQNKTPVILDYYEASLKKVGAEAPVLMPVQKMTAEQVAKNVLKKLEPFLDFYSELQTALETVGNVDEWIESESAVVELSDSNEAYSLPPSCKLIQAAVRQDSTVYVSPEVMKTLSAGQVGVLRLHESIYYLGTKRGHTNSIKARGLLAALLRENTPPRKIKELIDDFSSNALANQITCRTEDYQNAAADGNLNYVKNCLKEGLYIDLRNPVTKKTALGIAIDHNETEVAQFLLAQGANPNIDIAVSKAVDFNNRPLAKALLNAGAKNTAGAIAAALIFKDNLDFVKLLFENGASIDDMAYTEAVRFEQPNIINYFVSNKALPSFEVLKTTIMNSSRIDILELIINANKANLNPKDPFSATPLYLALEKEKRQDKYPFTETLIKSGAHPTIDDLGSSIRYISEKRPDVFKLIVQNADKSLLNAKSSSGKTMLFLAIEDQDLEKARILLEAGSLPDVTSTRDSNTPLFLVAQTINMPLAEKFIDLLMSFKANINLANEQGENPLMISLYRKNVVEEENQVYKALMKYHPNVNALDKKLENVLFNIAAFSNVPTYETEESADKVISVYKYFIEKGANPFQVNGRGETIHRDYQHRKLRKYFKKLGVPVTK